MLFPVFMNRKVNLRPAAQCQSRFVWSSSGAKRGCFSVRVCVTFDNGRCVIWLFNCVLDVGPVPMVSALLASVVHAERTEVRSYYVLAISDRAWFFLSLPRMGVLNLTIWALYRWNIRQNTSSYKGYNSRGPSRTSKSRGIIVSDVMGDEEKNSTAANMGYYYPVLITEVVLVLLTQVPS